MAAPMMMPRRAAAMKGPRLHLQDVSLVCKSARRLLRWKSSRADTMSATVRAESAGGTEWRPPGIAVARDCQEVLEALSWLQLSAKHDSIGSMRKVCSLLRAAQQINEGCYSKSCSARYAVCLACYK